MFYVFDNAPESIRRKAARIVREGLPAGRVMTHEVNRKGCGQRLLVDTAAETPCHQLSFEHHGKVIKLLIRYAVGGTQFQRSAMRQIAHYFFAKTRDKTQ